MAFKMSMAAKGFTFPDAHIEIVSVSIYRQTGKAHIHYRVYPTRAACLADDDANIINTGEIVVLFADMSAALGTFYAALEAKLLAQYPAAVAATDAIIFP